MKVTISNVFFVKEMDKNLLSCAKITEENKIVLIGKTAKIYNDYGNLIGTAYKINGIYKISSYNDSKKSFNVNRNVNTMTNKEKFHRLLGHLNFKYLENICKHKTVEGLPHE